MKYCPMCNGPMGLLGQLGNRKHWLCRNCGAQCSTKPKAKKSKKEKT